MAEAPNVEKKETGQLELLPVCENVREYLNLVRQTPEYQEIIEERLQNAQRAASRLKAKGETIEEVTFDEAKKIFEGTEKFKALFWDFYDRAVHLKYDPEQFSEKFRQAFEDYKVKVLQSLEASTKGREASIYQDTKRSEAHNKAAKVLEESGLVSTTYVGRMVVRAFLVDVGYDYLESARQADELRILRGLRDKNAIDKYMMGPHYIGDRFFSNESIEKIQAAYKRTYPEAMLVKAQVFRSKPDLIKDILGNF